MQISQLSLVVRLSCSAAFLLSAYPSLAAPTNGKACLSAREEDELQKFEKLQLGGRHAAEHAKSRVAKCEVEKGLRRVPAKDTKPLSGKAALEEEKATRRAKGTKPKGNDKGGKQTTDRRGGVSALILKSAATPLAAAATLAPAARGSMLAAALVPVPLDESVTGSWGPPFIIPTTGMHAVLMYTGKVMFWSYDPANFGAAGESSNYIWDPSTRAGYPLAPPLMLWCGGQTLLDDGRVLSIGGTQSGPDLTSGYKGANAAFVFDPATESWLATYGAASVGRWYPSLTRMADNRVVVRSGYDETGKETITAATEVFTPTPGGTGTFQLMGSRESFGLYPQQSLLPSGLFLEAGPDMYSSATYNHVTNYWSILPPLQSYHFNYSNKTSYSDMSSDPNRQIVMIAGGQNEFDKAIAGNEYLDGFNPDAGWRPFPSWSVPRYNANTVMLPDGSMVTVGGNFGPGNYDDPVFTTELYSTSADDLTGMWQSVGTHQIEAAYHSSAILLPDATVLLMQDDLDSSVEAAAQHMAQVYSPPYLFKGAQPAITSAPVAATLGGSFSVVTDRPVSSAVLVAPSAVTHANDMHQRVVKVQATASADGLQVTLPDNGAVVNPGYWMLFVLDAQGIPSVATFIKVSS